MPPFLERTTKTNSDASSRAVLLVLLAGVGMAATGGGEDSISLVRRKDTGWRLLPGSPTPDVEVKPDLSLRLRFADNPWMYWNPSRYSEGSVPYAGSTANWYDYFRANQARGEDPSRKGDARWIDGR